MQKKKIVLGILNSLAVLMLVACSTVDSQAGYTSASPRSSDGLATPPGLNSPDLSTNYKMAQVEQPAAVTSYKVANVHGMSIQSGGSERWLVIESQTVDKVWPLMVAYINQLGLSVKYQNQSIGVIQTDWAARTTKVPQGVGVRGFFDWVGWGNMYSLNSMYMYRVTLWQNGNQVIVMTSNYQMDEVYEGCGDQSASTTSSRASSDTQRTKWVAKPANPQLELEFLSQYMAFAGMPNEQVKKIVAQVVTAPKEASLINNQIIVQDQFDRAWWRTAVALDRIGLGIADKNRASGEYYVYPLQSQIDNPDPGVFSKWFGSDKESSTQALPRPLYTIKLTPEGNTTMITMSLYESQSQDKHFADNQKKYLDSLAQQLQ